MSDPVRRVLFADDDPTMTLLMQAALGNAGYAVTTVDNGRAALEEFRRAPFDIVLLDVEMPEMDGFEVCAEIRRGPRRETPVILVTSHDDEAFWSRVETLSAHHLAKPVDWKALHALLQGIL